VRGEGGGDRVLRHDGSIEAGNDLGVLAEGARRGRVHVARVARMLDPVHDRGVAVVGVRLGRLALEGALEGAVRTGVAAAAAGDGRTGRPCAGGVATAGHTRLA
jgi:hypothetical protein